MEYSLVTGLLLLVTGGGLLGARLISPSPTATTLPRPTLTITSPLSSLEVTAEGDSVWFPVSGESSDVVPDNSLRLYVLVHSGTEWHVQRPATLEQDGRWNLARAWVGDKSAPIRAGSMIQLMAVVSRQQRRQDEKIQDARELDPTAMSNRLTVTVQKVNRNR